ncbi:SH2 domain-containing protein 2A isoform X1 [Ochotona princeps]|uniref:SH2 domain-containing protein 2A isoform X1 n=1 Tax=Ochotona princeps TaxID=9978 RepID=UPI002714D8F6|nr:SH2 domain-containing protein 2A isoform X1 [Ochotona princeps]
MELPLAQICPPEPHESAPTPAFSTSQTMDLTHRSCQGPGLLPRPRLQVPLGEEVQPSTPRVPAMQTEVSPQALGAASMMRPAERAEEVPGGEGGQALQAEIRAWFQRTQAPWLLEDGVAPAWFHGFITRREAERLLEPKPQGCYLVRFSESAVTFVLTYRSRTCCRHFLLAQLRDGRHVVLGENSAHARLQDLLRHYTICPLSPYGETITKPLARQQTPVPMGLCLRTEETDCTSKNQDTNPQYTPIIRHAQTPAPTLKEGAREPKEPCQLPRPKPPIPAKPQPPSEVYTSPAPRSRPVLPPRPTNPIYHEPDEPIAFYAMGQGSPRKASSNIYEEVELPAALATGHPALRKCWSRPIPGSQNPSSGVGQQQSESSEAGQGPPPSQQPPLPWRHTLPHNLSRQALQDRGPLGPPQ